MNEKTVTVLTILSRIKAKSRMEPNSPGGLDIPCPRHLYTLHLKGTDMPTKQQEKISNTKIILT